jgi:hypothetical protein
MAVEEKRVAPEEKRCSHLYEDGRRCRSYRTLKDPEGRCAGHAGLNGDLVAAGAKGRATRTALRERRRLLGLRRADPRLLARVRMLERSEEIATRIVDAPLDDQRLGTLERQKALIAAHGFAFDEKVEVERPASASEVAAMGWRAVEKLAEVLLAQASADGTDLPVHALLEQSEKQSERAGSRGLERGVEPSLRDRALPAAG